MKTYFLLLSIIGLITFNCNKPTKEKKNQTTEVNRDLIKGKVELYGIKIDTTDLQYYDSSVHIPAPDEVFHKKLKKRSQAASFTTGQLDTLKKAIIFAETVVKDTLFQNLLNELSKENKIWWGSYRIGSLPQAEKRAPTAYIVSKFKTGGVYKIEDLVAHTWPTNSPTIAGSTCNDTKTYININKKQFDRPLIEIASTLIHEKSHLLCQRHDEFNQYPLCNKCDFAYLAGGLTIIILRYRANNSKAFALKKTDRGNLCGDLVEKLIKRKIILP